ncbi:FAD binding domain-containing protein [Treponema primitia]|uniref:FAD binding domain-containing protein n=1 Tax=Treponema primitia TaxID=88058 RepID=UPI0003090998|nr:FAD binding domain-containing protein [Treponema primitia]
MDALHNQVFFPASLPELFSAWTRFPDAVPFAGGGGLLRNQGKQILTLPRNILSLERLEELQKITRTERYLEIGAMVKLSEITGLGKIVPEALTKSLQGIASPQIRNLITLGGNICNPSRRQDASAPLVALDARYELRTAQEIRWVSASRFSGLSGPPALNPQELLTRIRIPLEQWHYTVYKKLTDMETADGDGGSAVFLARIQKNILTDIRVVFAGQILLRDKNSETILAGKQLPLDRRDAEHFSELWRTYLSAIEEPGFMLREKIFNFIESCIFSLSD